MVKSKKYDYSKTVALLNKTITIHNEASDLKGYQAASQYFINNCYQVGIIYENK